MHDKYFLIDGRWVASGSYNLSDNAEHNTLENMVIYDGQAFPEIVSAYEANFESIWRTGETEGRLAHLMQTVQSGGSFPIVFDPIALTWQQVTDLKRAMRTACTTIDSPDFRDNPGMHRFCNP